MAIPFKTPVKFYLHETHIPTLNVYSYLKDWTTILGSTHVVEQLSFSMFPSTLAFDFDLMLGSFLTFWTIMGYFWNWGRVRKLFRGLLM